MSPPAVLKGLKELTAQMTLSFVKISAASFCLLLHVLSSLTILMSSLPSKMVESGKWVLKSSSAVSWFDFVNSPEGVFSSPRPIDFVAFNRGLVPLRSMSVWTRSSPHFL